MILSRAFCLVGLVFLLGGACIASEDLSQPAATLVQSQSDIIRLAPQLRIVACLPTLTESGAAWQPEPSHHRRRDTLRRFAERVVAASLLDRSALELSSHVHGNKTADALGRAFSDLGGSSGLGTLGLAYLTSSGDGRSTYGTAIQAVAEAGLITGGLKFLTGRMRPGQAGEDTDAFHGPGSGYNSFPSGHTSNAFAIATVLSHERPGQAWLFYALATGVGLARMETKAHYLSDVVVGASIGTYAGKRALNHQTLLGKLFR